MSKQIEQARRGLSASELGHVDTAAPERAPGYVLLPGDPNRVEKMAAQWDEGAKLYALSRRSAAAVGTYKGVELGAWSTGIGGPSAECTLTDLAARGTHTFIRVGHHRCHSGGHPHRRYHHQRFQRPAGWHLPPVCPGRISRRRVL